MAKTQEELNDLKEEFETLNEKIRELTPEELEQVSGGVDPAFSKRQSAIVDHDDLEWKTYIE